MGLLAYNLVLRLYYFGISIASFFNSKAKKFLDGRKHIFKTMEDKMANETRKVVWFHAASLGEFEQGRPLIEAFKNKFTDYAVLLTFFSPSGYEVRKGYENADHVFYLPFDNRHNALRFIKLAKPSLAFFIKYEFWYHYIDCLKQANIPVFSVSAIFRPNQIFFKAIGKLQRTTLKKIDWFFVQDIDSAKLLTDINIHNVTVSGDTRFDRVNEIAKLSSPIDFLAEFKGNSKTLVVGSSWKEDMEVMLPLINQDPGIRFIIAPHEINESSLKNMEDKIRLPSIRYSNLNGSEPKDYKVLIIDNVGMLSKLYYYGEVAYIGGGFRQGLHNILEATAFGLPVIFGNRNYRKFKEARDLIEEGGAFAVNDTKEFQKVTHQLLDNDETLGKASGICKDFIQKRTGASQKILDHITDLIEKK